MKPPQFAGGLGVFNRRLPVEGLPPIVNVGAQVGHGPTVGQSDQG